MESCTGEALSVLLWADGDGVLAPFVLVIDEVKRLQRVGGGARGAMLQMDVLWTSLGDEPLIWFSFALERAFHRSK